MKLIKLPNKLLREKSLEIKIPLSKEDENIANKMIEYIKDSQDETNDLRPGIGIAAVQLGYLKRMLYINVIDENDEKFEDLLVNPKIIGESTSYAALKNGEGCLSVKEHEENNKGLVHRKFKIQISAYSFLQKKDITYTKIGYLAIVMQHELDHLNGKLFIDRIDDKNKWTEKDNEVII